MNAEHPGEKGPPTESISSVVGWAASGGLCPHWCKDTRTGPHWHDFVESLEAAGYKVAVAPAESGRCPGCDQPLSVNDWCPRCLKFAADFGSNAQVQP